MLSFFTKAALTLVVVGGEALMQHKQSSATFFSLLLCCGNLMPAFAVPVLKAPDLRHSAKVTVEEVYEAWAHSLKHSQAADACYKHIEEEDYEHAYLSCQQWWSEEDEGLAKDIAAGLVVLNLGELASQRKSPPRYPKPRRTESAADFCLALCGD